MMEGWVRKYGELKIIPSSSKNRERNFMKKERVSIGEKFVAIFIGLAFILGTALGWLAKETIPEKYTRKRKRD